MGVSTDNKLEKQKTGKKPAGERAEEITTNWELAATESLEPAKKFRYRFRRSRDRNYYKLIPWPAWWDEFNSAIDKNGRRKYRTSWSFICAKTKIHWQRTVLWEMIGPEPVQTSNGENEFLRVPYLGDWEQRRRNGFYVFEDLTKAKAVQEALKHRNDSRETIRALAPLIAKRMAFWYQIRDQITEGYAGKIFEDNKPVTDVEQKKRVDVFLGWQRGVERDILRLEKQWMRIHGVDPLDPGQQWITTAALGGKVGAAVAQISSPPMLILNGEELPLPEDITYDAILLAHHLRTHAETFGLPLPEDQEKAQKPKCKSLGSNP
jgi:hypothetical protein